VALQTDNQPVTDTATVFIQVLNPGIRPRNDAATTTETTPVTVPFFTNDTRPSTLTTYFKANPAVTPKNGLVNFDLNAGTAIYTANSGFFGKDTVGYYLCAGLPNGEYCLEAIIVITVEKRIFNVKANNDTVFTRANTPVVFNPTINDKDSNNVLFAGVTILSPPTRGTYTQNQLLLRYVPQTDFVGTDRMRYRVCNGLNPPVCDSAEIVLYVLPAEPPIIPSGFSPNEDNINDFFVIENIKEYSNPKITIINRWGNEVWAGQPYRDNWNGINRNNEPLPAGTYFYLLELGPDLPIYRGFIVIQR
jgi:gliding motility-associated-like protein